MCTRAGAFWPHRYRFQKNSRLVAMNLRLPSVLTSTACLRRAASMRRAVSQPDGQAGCSKRHCTAEQAAMMEAIDGRKVSRERCWPGCTDFSAPRRGCSTHLRRPPGQAGCLPGQMQAAAWETPPTPWLPLPGPLPLQLSIARRAPVPAAATAAAAPQTPLPQLSAGGRCRRQDSAARCRKRRCPGQSAAFSKAAARDLRSAGMAAALSRLAGGALLAAHLLTPQGRRVSQLSPAAAPHGLLTAIRSVSKQAAGMGPPKGLLRSACRAGSSQSPCCRHQCSCWSTRSDLDASLSVRASRSSYLLTAAGCSSTPSALPSRCGGHSWLGQHLAPCGIL